MNGQLENALEYCLNIIERNMAELAYFPERWEDGAWLLVDKNRVPSHWVDGFWTGQLWLAFALTGDAAFEAAARRWTAELSWLKETTLTHDLGFIFYLSNVLGYRITGDETLLADALQAAETFTQRYNPRGEYMQAWGRIDGPPYERGRINIDLMMNMPFFFWASSQSGNARYARIAARHARTTRMALIRPNGSVSQCADFEPESGAFLRQSTHQGLSHDGCWSRGLAWGLYGFAETYQWTSDPVFLHTARRIAEYALANAPADKVPFWDYDSLDIPKTYRDTSAAAVIAGGLLELADGESYEVAAQRWRDEAVAIMQSLWQTYSTRDSGISALLVQGSRSVPANMMNHPLVYGDYYFLETLLRLLRPELSQKLFIRNEISN